MQAWNIGRTLERSFIHATQHLKIVDIHDVHVYTIYYTHVHVNIYVGVRALRVTRVDERSVSSLIAWQIKEIIKLSHTGRKNILFYICMYKKKRSLVCAKEIDKNNVVRMNTVRFL